MSSKTSTFLLALVVSGITGVTAAQMTARAPESKAESAYERVIRTQTLRCGYVSFLPNMVKDSATGKLSGLDVDIAEALGRKLGLKIVWTEEVGWATVVPALQARKFDVLCSGNWINPKEGMHAYFTRPYYYQGAFIVARTGDTRFDTTHDSLNRADVSIASMDGDMPRFIAEEDFPKAKIFTLPDMAGMAMTLESVTTRKADVTISDAYNFGVYNEQNPGKMKLVQIENPVRLYPVGFVVPMGDDKLRTVLNTAFDEMIYSGQMERLIKPYDKYPHSFIPVERPRVAGER